MPDNLKFKTDNCKGFTLMEIIVAVSIFSLVVIVAYSFYSLGQRVYREGGNQMEVWQNGRATLDRMTREIRQAEDLVTVIPPVNDDELNPPASELEFQNGHDLSQITYIRYYLNGADLMWQHKYYYFDEEPGTYVAWNSVDEFDNPPESNIIDERMVGEYFIDMDFWGADKLINIYINLEKNGEIVELQTAVAGRNL